MFDTHSHLNLDPLYSNWPEHIQSAKSAGISRILVLGTGIETNHRAIELATQSPVCFAAVGLHPELATQIIDQNLDLDQLLDQVKDFLPHKQVVAIGEVGLDYHWIADHSQADRIIQTQHQLFEAQIQLAQDSNLPLSIHVRDAQTEIIKLLSKYQPRAVLHCFDGNEAYLKQALDLGLYISFAGNLTFKNATHLHLLVKQVPHDRLLLETDSPYLNPVRGQFPNTPAHLVHTYRFAADLLNLDLEQLTAQLNTNASHLFKI